MPLHVGIHDLYVCIYIVRNSESALTAQLHISQDASSFPSMALDKEKRKVRPQLFLSVNDIFFLHQSYHNTSRAQVKATLKGIAAAQKNLVKLLLGTTVHLAIDLFFSLSRAPK